MDSITQIALGAAVGELVLGRRVGYRAAVWGGICGTLPDLDVLIDFGGAVQNFTYHRGFSHSVFVLTLLAPALAWVIDKIHPTAGATRHGWLVLVWLALITHPLLDCFTVYGTQILWPLNPFPPISWSSIFIIDPGFTLPLLIGVICALCLSRSRARDRDRARHTGNYLNTAGLLLGGAYLAWTVHAKFMVDARASAALAANQIQAERLLTTPAPFNSLLWRVVAMVDDGYYEGFYSFFDDPGRPLELRFFPSQTELLEGIEPHWAVARLQWFTHGFYAVHNQNGNVIINDLRMGLEPTYFFRFKVATTGPAGSEPAVNERLEAIRDLTRLDWVWQRIWGPVDY